MPLPAWAAGFACHVPTSWTGRAFAVLGLLLFAAAIGLVRLPTEPPLRTLDVRGRRALACVAALLSLGYVEVYLGGGPRVIDAAAYWLQARLLAGGHFTFLPPDPSASFRGRFLLAHGGRLGGIFPPGWPLLLSLGMRLGAPFLVGPLVAAGLVYATRGVALELAPRDRVAPLIAGGLSTVCAALRYHTADTMSHGAAALELALVLALALRSRRTGRIAAALAAGMALGALVATRPVSAVGPALALIVLLRRNRKGLGCALLGAVPFVGFLLASQAAVTGSAWASTQLTYYAQSDGPPGCFRYGFGRGIGCLFEHGDFVGARLSAGYGFAEAAGTTLRRLRLHLLDVTNSELLTLVALVLVAASLRRHRLARYALALVVLHILAYAPFYFDGNYPGGGARLFADVLPLEHALIAVALSRLAARATRKPVLAVLAAGTGAVASMCAGFAFRAVREHEALRARDGGRPAYEPEVLARANLGRALVFVDGDHAFDEAFEPAARVPPAIAFARLRSDGHDALLADRLGSPPTYRYRFGVRGSEIVPYDPPRPFAGVSIFEAESDWPPIAQEGGYAVPVWYANDGASQGVVLEVRGEEHPVASIELPVPRAGRLEVAPDVFLLREGSTGKLTLKAGAAALTSWTWLDPSSAESEHEKRLPRERLALPPRVVTVDSTAPLVLFIEGARGAHGHMVAIALDRVSVLALGR